MIQNTISENIVSFRKLFRKLALGVTGTATILLVFGFMVMFGNFHINEGDLIQKLREKDPDIGFITDTERHIIRKTIVSAVTTNGERLNYFVDSNFQHEYDIQEVR